MTALGTHAFGRSDMPVALRRFFDVERQHIALTSLTELAHDVAGRQRCATAIERCGLHKDGLLPWAG